MDHRNLDKAMEIFACLITGETVGKDNHRDLYDARHPDRDHRSEHPKSDPCH